MTVRKQTFEIPIDLGGEVLPIVVTLPNGAIENVIGINNAARKFKLHVSSIWRVLQNKQRQTKGYYFEYKQIAA